MSDSLEYLVRQYFENKDKLRKASELRLGNQDIMITKLRIKLFENKIKERLNENKGE